jgi:hypothetical protein
MWDKLNKFDEDRLSGALICAGISEEAIAIIEEANVRLRGSDNSPSPQTRASRRRQ